MSGASQLDLSDVENDIHAILKEILQRDYKRFRCEQAILYWYDNTTRLLEPMLMRPSRPYGQVRGLPSSRASGYIASVAFDLNSVRYSRSPQEDPTLSEDAKRLLRDYQLSGALVAVPVPPPSAAGRRLTDKPLGVLVVSADRTLDYPDPEDDVRLFLHEDTVRLAFLLVCRERAWENDMARKYQELNELLFSHQRPIGTREVTATRLGNTLRHMLRADEVLVDVRDSAQRRIESRPVTVSTSLDSNSLDPTVQAVRREVRGKQWIVMNRGDDGLYGHLAELVSPQPYAWMAACADDDETNITCVVGRRVNAIKDHLTVHEADFLWQTTRVFQFLLKRSANFEEMCRHLASKTDDTSGAPVTKAEFQFICHLLWEFLSVDQVLLTKVTKEREKYVIDGVFARGFEQNNDWIVRKTHRELPDPKKPPSHKMDVLSHILQSYLAAVETGRLPLGFDPLFPVEVDRDYSDLELDKEVVEKCKLRGTVCYLSCISTEADDPPELRCILHLGYSSEEQRIPPQGRALLEKPFLKRLAAGIAESAARNERVAAEQSLRDIHVLTEPTPNDLHKIVDEVSRICHSIGSTLFLRCTLLHLIGWEGVSPRNLRYAFETFLPLASDWSQPVIGANEDRILEMLGAFLGLERQEFMAILKLPGCHKLVPLLAQSLYVQVAQSGEPAVSTPDISRLVRPNATSQEFLDGFVPFLAKECYLPGYGLTGWGLRYGYDMLLPDKHEDTVRGFFTENQGSIPQPRLSGILKSLRGLSSDSILALPDVVPPRHADHIQDQKDWSQENDSFLACLLEEIDDPQYPSGILRTSTSVTLRTHFTGDHCNAVRAVTRHISWILRREYTRQQQFTRTNSDEQELLLFHQHRIGHVAQALKTVEEYIPRDKPKAWDALKQLTTVASQIGRYGLYGKLLRELSRLRDRQNSPGVFEKYLNLVLNDNPHRDRIQVAVTANTPKSDGRAPPLDCLLRLCFLVDEIITNHIKYSARPEKNTPCDADNFVVLISGLPPFTIQIVVCDMRDSPDMKALLPLPAGGCHPYGDLLQGKRGGGGTRLYETVITETDCDVQFCRLRGIQWVYLIVSHSSLSGPYT